MAHAPIRIRRRAAGGASGAPDTLLNAEPAYNEVDDVLYYGKGDDGSGTATSVIPIGGKGAYVDKSSAQTISGVKTFSASPVVPEPTTDGQAANKKYVDEAMADAGAGDMLKSVYDSNDDGKVDAAAAADTVPWSGVSGKPTTFTPATHTHAAGDVTSGTFDAARIPTLDAAKVATGAFDAARIPSLDASKVGSGVFDIARIPVLPSQVQVVSTGNIAALTSPQQAQIGQGTIVTTTDGRRWVYSGTGSKTAEASYIELADVTPDWSIIANKPSFHAVATSGAYGDLTGRPTLGSVAAQDANNVAITGGTITGVVVDGGTF